MSECRNGQIMAADSMACNQTQWTNGHTPHTRCDMYHEGYHGRTAGWAGWLLLALCPGRSHTGTKEFVPCILVGDMQAGMNLGSVASRTVLACCLLLILSLAKRRWLQEQGMPVPSSPSSRQGQCRGSTCLPMQHTQALCMLAHPAPWLKSSAVGSRELLLSCSANASAASLASLFRTSCCSLCLMGSNLALNLHQHRGLQSTAEN